jgi:hypothetical protein
MLRKPLASVPSKRGVRGADLGVDIPKARLAMMPRVLGTALFLGVPAAEGVAGSNRGCLLGASNIDCSAESSSCMSTSESGKFIGEDIVSQISVVDSDRGDEDNGKRVRHACVTRRL